MREKKLSDQPRREALSALTRYGSGGFVAVAFAGFAKSASGQSPQGDVGILSAALILEYQAIAAYQAGAESKLLPPNLLQVAVAFQGDHKYHRDGILNTMKTLGATPPEAPTNWDFGPLPNATAILVLACQLESGAVDAYSGLAANIENRDVLNYAAHVLADEVRHRTVLNGALGRRNY